MLDLTRDTVVREWLVWCPDEGGTVETAFSDHTFGPKIAVERWAENYDLNTNRYAVAKGRTPVVCVRLKEGGPVTKFKVAGHFEPEYEAEPVET